MKITLKSLEVSYFKNIRSFKLENISLETLVAGKNRSGKTTLMDAFIWLLFDKDSNDAKQFSIKTIENNNPIHRIEHSVEAVINIDDRYDAKLKKVFKEKWTKRRGEETETFDGHETIYYYNDVPVTASSYKEKIAMLCSEDTFKAITSPMYFNSLKWDKQREILMKMAGDIQDKDIVAGNFAFQGLLDKLTGKSFTEYKAMIGSQKKKLKDELSTIPSRIDEAQKSMPDKNQIGDFDKIRGLIQQKKNEIDLIEGHILSENKRYEEKNKQLVVLKNSLIATKSDLADEQMKIKQEVELEAKKDSMQLSTLSQQITDLKMVKDSCVTKIADYKAKITYLTETNNKLRKDAMEINQSEYKGSEQEGDFTCPVFGKPCGMTDYLAERDDTAKENFNKNKAQKIAEINKAGIANKTNIETLTKQVEETQAKEQSYVEQIADIEAKIKQQKENQANSVTIIAEKLAQKISESQAIKTFNTEIESIQKQIQEKENQSMLVDVDIVAKINQKNEQKKVLISEIDSLNKTIGLEEVILKAKERIVELEQQLATYNQKIAELEKEEMVICDFEKTKITEVEKRVNQRFSFVKFRMFKPLINGGEEPDCTCMVNGVPYSDVNTEGKINAGLDIINALCDYYNVYAPVFIDNRESVTEIIPVKSQVISLMVSPLHDKLTVVNDIRDLKDETPIIFEKEKDIVIKKQPEKVSETQNNAPADTRGDNAMPESTEVKEKPKTKAKKTESKSDANSPIVFNPEKIGGQAPVKRSNAADEEQLVLF